MINFSTLFSLPPILSFSSQLEKGLKSKSPRLSIKASQSLLPTAEESLSRSNIQRTGFLVDAGDWHAVAGYLLELWTNDKLYEQMSTYGKHSVSDEVGTVGNALSWFYLADKFANAGGKDVEFNERWVNDLAREQAGIPYREMENRLPRF
jgi:hypothetical protein